ncbi:hypothetical protein D9M70_350350 [compost metagenome]
MAGEAVAQHVRVQVLAEFAHAGLAHAQLDRPRAEAAALLADEHRAVGRPALRAQRQPGFQRGARLAADRQHAGLAALAVDFDQTGGEVELLEVEADQLGQAQSGGIEQLEQGLVAAGDEVVLDRAVEQLRRAVGIQGARQALFALGRTQAAGRVVLAQPFADQVAIEAAHRRQQARQRAAGLALGVQAGDEAAQAARVERGPGGDAGLVGERHDLVQIAAVAVEGVRRDLSLAAQVFEVGVQLVLHGSSCRRGMGSASLDPAYRRRSELCSRSVRMAGVREQSSLLQKAAGIYLTERSGAAKRGSTRARTSAT